ncbi:MAG: DNA-processing protein DprA [Nitrospirae bacterium]|nr:DNA-processing protein DprA [Nitrospirota bacterium]
MNPVVIKLTDALYPSALREVFKKDAPEAITAIGNPDLLKENKLAVFCSSKCPGELILKTYDFLRQLKESSQTVISGFHSTIEQECLNILLKRRQNIIICPARSIEGMKINKQYQKPIEEGRLLFLSPFDIKNSRISAQRSEFRNQFVAAIADKILIPHAAPDSKTERLCRQLIEKGKTILTFDAEHNRNLIELGAMVIVEKGLIK